MKGKKGSDASINLYITTSINTIIEYKNKLNILT